MTTEERLEKLERELAREKRRNRWLLSIVLLGLPAVLAGIVLRAPAEVRAEKAEAGEKVIRANQFIVEDAKGNKRAVLGTSLIANWTRLALYDPNNGRQRLSLDLHDGEPYLNVSDANDFNSLALSCDSDGSRLAMYARGRTGTVLETSKARGGPRLIMEDVQGVRRVELGSPKEGPKLSMSDRKGKERVLVTEGDGIPKIRLADGNGTPSAVLFTTDFVGPALCLCGETGRNLAVLAVNRVWGSSRLQLYGSRNVGPFAGPELAFYDANDTRRVQLNGDPDRGGLVLSDANGTDRIGLGWADDKAGLILSQESGRVGAALRAGRDNESLILSDEDGKDRVHVTVDKLGAGVSVVDEKSEAAAALVAVKNKAGFDLYDEKGTNRAKLAAVRETTVLNLLDERGALRATLRAPRDGPQLNLFDEKGSCRASFKTSTSQGGPALMLFDEKSRKRAEFRVIEDGPGLIVFDNNGRQIWATPNR